MFMSSWAETTIHFANIWFYNGLKYAEVMDICPGIRSTYIILLTQLTQSIKSI